MKEFVTLGTSCFNESNVTIVDFTERSMNKRDFNAKLITHFSTNTSRNNVSMASMWFPVLQDFSSVVDPNFQQNFLWLDLVFADSVAVITRRWNVEIQLKIAYSFLNLVHVLIMLLYGAISISFITWLVVSEIFIHQRRRVFPIDILQNIDRCDTAPKLFNVT